MGALEQFTGLANFIFAADEVGEEQGKIIGGHPEDLRLANRFTYSGENNHKSPDLGCQ